MITTIDQLGNAHQFTESPCRIVSLVPSITELLCDLGLQNKVVGCTKFCVHPKGLKKNVAIVGGTKKVNIQKVKELQPDLIIANKEENKKEDIEALRNITTVWVSDIDTIDRAYDMIRSIGDICSVQVKAESIIDASKAILSISSTKTKSVVYLIWKSPYMTIGGDTFIHDMLKASGYENVFGESLRYPEVTIEEIKKQQPDVIFLSSEPFPFKEKHVVKLKEALGDIPIVLVDGEYFSWYGSRILHCTDYINRLREHIEKEDRTKKTST